MRNASGEVHFTIQISMGLLDFEKKLVMKIAEVYLVHQNSAYIMKRVPNLAKDNQNLSAEITFSLSDSLRYEHLTA